LGWRRIGVGFVGGDRKITRALAGIGGIMTNKAKTIITELLDLAQIKINGDDPWDIRVHDERFYDRVLMQPSLGMGESYMDGWWDCPNIDQAVFHLVRANLKERVVQDRRFSFNILHTKFINFISHLFNYQSRSRSSQVGERHYDIGNDLYQRMLDPRMNYSCGYWQDSDNLTQAQEAKLKLTCEKLQLKPGMRVLDIGCGWGAFSKYAAENYGVTVLGVTISQKQYQFAKEACAGLPIEIRLQDYRSLHEKVDRVCSIGMFEHVGYRNYHDYMQVARRCLKDDGLFLLHTIGSNASFMFGDEWLNRYIFPNGMLPSIKQIGSAIEKLFVMEDWHNFGADYDKTAMAWQHNFIQHWPELKQHYDDRFYRMWNYYLLSCAGAFRARDVQLWQIVLSPQGVVGGYRFDRRANKQTVKQSEYCRVD
jgi:cyclopropane-fatty-acyl-phospholipid synthase